MAHIFFVDTAVATAAYGQPNTTTISYLPYNVIEDPRETRQLPILQVPDASTGATLITDTTSLFASDDITSTLFYLIEQVFYMSDVVTQEQLEAQFVAATTITYVAESLTIAETQSVTSTRFDADVTIAMPKAMSFKIIVDTEEVTVNVWFDNAYMIAHYLDTRITAIIPAMDLDDLYVQNTLINSGSDLSVAAATASYIASHIATAIAENDNTGIVTLTVKYYTDTDIYIEIPFSMLYCGHVPGTISMQQAIRTYLLASGVGDESGWTSRIPSLFVSGTYYVVPFWDSRTTSGDRSFYPSHMRIATATQRLNTTLYDFSSVMTYAVVLPTTFDCIITGIVPDPNNTTGHFDIEAEHPTYQDVSSTSTAFQYMDANTQRFSTLLGRALAVANGESSDTFFETVIMDDRTFVAFNIDGIAYYILNKETYTTLVA